jgi:surface antigen
MPYGLDLGHCNRDVLGAVIGGAAGAALGSRVDKDDGRKAAIVGGAIIGVLVGGAIGRYMDSVDQNCIGQTLEYVPDGETIVWNNPNNGGTYQVTPAETYQRADGRYCREYVTEVLIGGRREQAYGDPDVTVRGDTVMRLLTILVVAGALVMAGPALAGKKNKGNGNNGKSNQPSTTEQILTKAVVGGLITLAERAIIGDYVASHRSQFAGAQALPPGIAKKVARGGFRLDRASSGAWSAPTC